MELLNTTRILEELKSFYEASCKNYFHEYMAELEFTTVLTYYSGSCALIIEVTPTPIAQAQTNICIMVECREDELASLNQEVIEHILQNKLLQKHKELFALNRILCSRKMNRRIVIKNTSFHEPVISIKLDQDAIYLDINYKKLHELRTDDLDMIHILSGISENLQSLQKV